MAKEETCSQRDIAVQLNNAIAATLRPARLGPIPEARLRKLHRIAQALIAPAQELLVPESAGESPIIEPEELVACLAVASLYVHLTNVMGTTRIPFGALAKEVYDVDPDDDSRESNL
tara:strand:+ start:41 stop:391 length:351 start_codon:yes stop_codon:yes gene_type:complete